MPTYINHLGDPAHAHFITDYVEVGVANSALLGPFLVLPFSPWAQCSPMMTRPKADPTKRRVIVDLSYPPRRSVNAGIPWREYLGRPTSYSLPSAADLGRRLVEEGVGAHMWTADGTRA